MLFQKKKKFLVFSIKKICLISTVCHSENFIAKISVNILILLQKNGLYIIRINIVSNFLTTIVYQQKLRIIYLILHFMNYTRFSILYL